ncbi:hypothetical protein CF327_g4731 [Tilletia walkeri]|nr:hypothetical protein CF327_g4731 [Tilletia walkeri]
MARKSQRHAHASNDEEKREARRAVSERVDYGVELHRTGLSLQLAALKSGAAAESIRRRANGTQSQVARTQKGPQRLTEEEESALVKFVLKMEQSGFPMRRADVEDSALSLITARTVSQAHAQSESSCADAPASRAWKSLVSAVYCSAQD